MLKIIILVLLFLPSNAFAMCTCKANCRKDFDFKEFSTYEEAVTEAKKHKAISIQKYGDKYQILIWDENLACESGWPDTCQCDNEKY